VWEPGWVGVDVTGGLMTQRYLPSGGAGGDPLRAPALLIGPGIALVAALVLTGCGSSTSDAPARAVLAGSAADRTASAPDLQIDPMPSDGQTPSGGEPWDATATERCASAVAPGLTQVAQSADGSGVTTFWTEGPRWAVCDHVAGTEPTVLAGVAKAREGFDEQALSVATTAVPAGSGGGDDALRVVAGGRLPWPVQEISYTFPDGHTEDARFVSGVDAVGNGWWAVTYTVTDGVLVAPEAEAAALEPVTISVVGAAAEAFRLPWEDLQRSE
jgi:hypothetical protein